MTTVMQRKGAQQSSLELTSNCFWNASTDGQTAVRWENDNLHVIMSLFSCAL